MKKKLSLKKSIIANLNRDQMNELQGGNTWIYRMYYLNSVQGYCSVDFEKFKRNYLQKNGGVDESWALMPG